MSLLSINTGDTAVFLCNAGDFDMLLYSCPIHLGTFEERHRRVAGIGPAVTREPHATHKVARV